MKSVYSLINLIALGEITVCQEGLFDERGWWEFGDLFLPRVRSWVVHEELESEVASHTKEVDVEDN